MTKLIPLEKLNIECATQNEWDSVNNAEHSVDLHDKDYGWFFDGEYYYKANYGSLRPAIKLKSKESLTELKKRHFIQLYNIVDAELNSLVIHTLYARYLEHDCPICGDYVVYESEPTQYHTIGHVYSDSVQTTYTTTSLFLCNSGKVSFSGCLDTPISVNRLSPTSEWREQTVWIFDKEQPRAGGAVHYRLPFKVWHAGGKPPIC